jgi:AcrR family transcriptional regulator
MSRWEPDAAGRLQRAALELFLERGYDDTTVAEITERAGLTKKTFFRHFADKREILFSGQEALSQLSVDAIAGAPGPVAPINMIAAALEAVEAVFTPEMRELARQRQSVIAGNSGLRERELLKRATFTAALGDALRGRGVADPIASLAAEVGGLAFRMTYARWIHPASQQDFADLAHQALEELGAATTALSPGNARPVRSANSFGSTHADERAAGSRPER